MDSFEVTRNEDDKIIDFLSQDLLEPKPEEFVRQTFLRMLYYEYKYPIEVLAREVPIQYGSKEIVDSTGNPIRADIVVYHNKTARINRDQGQISFVVECKSPSETTGYNQLVSYIFNTSAAGGVWFNNSGTEDQIQYFRRITEGGANQLIHWTGIPRYKETWNAIARRKKSDLLRPKNINGLLRRCHNKLHGRGVEAEEEDLTMDMVRIILAKAQDEERPGELPEFYCTPEEYNSEAGRQAVAERVQNLFNTVKELNSDVFAPNENITVGSRAISDVVIELQNFQMLSNLEESKDWDLMGHAYEEYTSTYLKRKRGQFFTNRLVIDFMVEVIAPTYTDTILDLAGGSGGFLTGSMRYVRKTILESAASRISKQRQLDGHRTRLFLIEVSKRLVKVAKTAMILNGDGHTGMTQGDSLGPYSDFKETIVAQCSKGKPTIILTNPPFAGTGEGRITQKEVLERFLLGKKWIENESGEYVATDELASEGAPPEMLFFERCIDWLAPGGKIGIVMPKSFLDTQTYLPARKIMFKNCQLLGVVNCHKNTFSPHTGVRTCLVFLRKYGINEKPNEEYPIFLAISRKIGQDSEGVPIYKKDKQNRESDELDHDLNEILAAYKQFITRKLKDSEYAFSVRLKNIGQDLNINPQSHLPSLNATIRQVARIDDVNGWSVVALSQIAPNVSIFKGPRFKSENLIVEGKINDTTERYYTPSAVLQEKSESFKWMDVSKANKNQQRTIKAIRAQSGDIMITRSGSIGRVAYITKRLTGAIISDDFIRVRISDEKIRLYVYYYLQTKYAQDQIRRNEYGAVQQHMEQEHIRELLIPVPENWDELEGIISNVKRIIELEEQKYDLDEATQRDITTKIESLVKSRNGNGKKK